MRADTEVKPQRLLHSPKNTARILDCGLGKVYDLEHRGFLEVVPFDGLKRYTDESVRAVAANGTGKRHTKRPPIPRRRRPDGDMPPAAV